MKAILANLGFVLQTAGLIILLAIPMAIIYNEQSPLISFLITSIVFLVLGFLLNAFSQRKELDYKSSCILITIVFFLLGLIGSIPYLYTNIFADSSVISKVVNSFFESVSGFSTTGLSMITNVDALPRSIVFYRGLTQWVGGISIVFIFVAFFYSDKVLDNLSRAIGAEKLTTSLRKSFSSVLLIYTVYTAIFILLFYFLGLKSWVTNISLVFSTISTGSFSPVTNFSTLVAYPYNVVLIVLMIIGGISFSVHFSLFTGKLKRILSGELLAFFLIIGVFTIGFSLLTKFNLATSLFHVTSASSTTGFSFIDMGSLAANAKVLLIILMFVGGSAFSTAGGVKIFRIMVFIKSIPWAVKGIITRNLGVLKFGGREMKHADIISAWLMIILAVSIIFIFAFIFTLYGFPLVDSVFELTSAFATAGLSVGITSIRLAIGLKIILAFFMLLGRIELISFLIAILPETKKKEKVNSYEIPVQKNEAEVKIPNRGEI